MKNFVWPDDKQLVAIGANLLAKQLLLCLAGGSEQATSSATSVSQRAQRNYKRLNVEAWKSM